MTDEEIEKALRVCIETTNNCIGCAYYEKGVHGINCRNMLICDTLGYINRLKAKNKELQDKNRRVLDWKRRQEKLNNEMIDRFDEELKKLKEQIRKDTAKDIIQLMKQVQEMFYDKEYTAIQNIISKRYGVEVDNE